MYSNKKLLPSIPYLSHRWQHLFSFLTALKLPSSFGFSFGLFSLSRITSLFGNTHSGSTSSPCSSSYSPSAVWGSPDCWSPLGPSPRSTVSPRGSCIDLPSYSFHLSPLPAPCCSCGRCHWCCSCCHCWDGETSRAAKVKWYGWLLSSLTSPSGTEGVVAEGAAATSSGRGGGGGGGGADGQNTSTSVSPPKTCCRCGQPFSLLFNKRVTCGGCSLSVCRKCAPWNTSHKAYVCSVCSKPPSDPRRGGAGASSDESYLKEIEASVRSHIEALVENQVGGPLDQVTAEPNISTLHHQNVFRKHHGILSYDVGRLSYSLQMSILDRPLPTEDLPTSRHAQLSEDVTQAIKEAMILPAKVEGYDPVSSPETPVEDFNSHTYEDILATAILNKVLESCEGERPDEVTIEVSHEVTSTDTDSGMSGGVKESRRKRGKRSEVSEAGSECSDERSLTPQRLGTPPVSPDQGVVTDDSWAQAASGDGPPLQFKIEEHVEEITTHHLTDDEQDLEGFEDDDISDSGGSWRGSRCSLDDSRGRPRRREKVSHHTAVAEDGLLSTLNIPLPDPSFAASRRVSFPELGADIIQDSCSDTECCSIGPGDMVVEAESWEQNWLFRRQKLVKGSSSDPVTMLIPNPDNHVPATVGNRDVDELSELSERQSLGSGEPWSTSDSEGEYETRGDIYCTYPASRELSTLAGEIVAEFAQQDQEYTVDYSVPSRVTASGSPETSLIRTKPPLSQVLSPKGQNSNFNQIARGYNGNASVDGIKNPAAKDQGFSHTETNLRYDDERPVPKPRKLSLANSTSKTSLKSPVHLMPSPSEDLSILSPPLDVPYLKETSSNSETVWFVGIPEDCTVMQGRTLRLVCQVNTKRPMGLSWYHNGSLVSVNGRDMWGWRKGSYHYLHIYSMSPTKAGTYAAAAYTTTDCVWAFCKVEYKASSRPQKRPTFTKGLSDIIVEAGTDLELQCQVTGHPEPRVVFSKGSEKLCQSSRVSIENDQYGTWTLKVSDCAVTDSDEISATATNSIAAISTRCQVRVVPEGTIVTHKQDSVDSGQHKASTNKQCGPNNSSSNRNKPGKAMKYDSKSHNTGSSLPIHSSWSSQNNINPLTSNTDHCFNQTPDVISDGDDITDIQQVPTKPGFPSSDVPLGTSLELDYYPSSHDDNSSFPSDDEDRIVAREFNPLYPLSSSSTVVEALNPVLVLNSLGSFLPNDQQHASSTFSSHNTLGQGECLKNYKTSGHVLSQGLPPQPGTIADREHRKWEAAIPIANNPYAPEKLVHRLSNFRSSSQTLPSRHGIKVDFSDSGEGDLDPSLRNGVPPQADLNRYSRDYYIASNSALRQPLSIQMKAQHKFQQSAHQQFEQPLPQKNSSPVSLTNGVQEDAGGYSQLSKSQVHIHIFEKGSNGTTVSRVATNIKSNRQDRASEIETSKPSDWKDELKDIQSARVEQEVARFQRTIDETQRRWEANYARHAIRGPGNIQSDSSTEVLHNPRQSVFLVPPRHDLWRTVSVDTISTPPQEKVLMEPLQRHISVDNLRLTKVSNLRNLGSADQCHTSSVNTVSSISSINLNSMNKVSRYHHNQQHIQSVESMSGYSDGESHGDGNETDVSTRTQDEIPLLPSVRKLASKFDLASQERVNDLDKHETDGNLTFYGKKNIFLSDKSPTDQPYSRNFTNNLNKRTEKPYTIKEVRPLPNKPSASSSHTSSSPDNDPQNSEHDDSEFDDQTTIASVSLPPTPYSLDGRLSISTSSLLDSDSCFSPDCRDSYKTLPSEENTKTIFGVTLRRVTPGISSSRGSRSYGSFSSISSEEAFKWPTNRHIRRFSSNSSFTDYERGTSHGYTDSDSDTYNALRQVTIIKIQDKNRPEYQSLTNLYEKGSPGLANQRSFKSTIDVRSDVQTSQSLAEQKGLKSSFAARNSRKSMPDLSIPPSSAFVQKGRRKSMHEFLKSYRKQMSLNEINRIDEKAEDEFKKQRISKFMGQQNNDNIVVTSSLKKAVSSIELDSCVRVKSLYSNSHVSHSAEAENKSVKLDKVETENIVGSIMEKINLDKDSNSETISLGNDFEEHELQTSTFNLEESELTTVRNVNGETCIDSDMVQSKHISDISKSMPSIVDAYVAEQPKAIMTRKKSMSDFLKLYSNITSLSEKSAFKIKENTVQEPKEENKTVITISNTIEPQLNAKQVVIQPQVSNKDVQIQSKVSHELMQPKSKQDHNENNLKPRLAKVANPLNLDRGTDHQTIITLSGETPTDISEDSIYHASIVYVGDGPDTVNASNEKENMESTTNFMMIKDSHSEEQGRLLDKTVKYHENSMKVIDSGNHITVISVEEPVVSSPISPVSDAAGSVSENIPGDSDEEFDPISLTRRIVASSRLGSSNKPYKKRKVNIVNATVPINSPFSPVSKGKLAVAEPKIHSVADNFNSVSLTENISPKNLGSQEFNDEGVDFTLSDADLPPSATESKSTSSLDNIGKEGSETMVLCH
ncbi:serine-rich adhesin for platelets-like isoform X3 [Palaemon carinicauda]|uniref:serine-rich adhesin for platelets-like isoform X3 n=1 Tax=Palaemon carinicauda TaxID=392227 RepID=UPI0035B57507